MDEKQKSHCTCSSGCILACADGEPEEADNWAAVCGVWTRGSGGHATQAHHLYRQESS